MLLSDADVARFLSPEACVAAVEAAFRARGEGVPQPGGVLGVHVDGGGFHVKAATLGAGAPYFAVKLNGNFPANPAAHGLPTIQGLVLLCDAATGAPLAIMASGVLTRRRTAAATAVAARYLAAPGATRVAVIGAGAQALDQVEALLQVRALTQVLVFDIRTEAAHTFAQRARDTLGVAAIVTPDLEAACAGAQIIVTCTPSQRAFLGERHVAPGAFVAAVGADNETKQEIEPALLAASAVVTDVTAQCALIGDLHHAMAAGAMRESDVRAELGEVVAGRRPGRRSDDERVVFDSTGTPIQDAAAAAIVYERARASGAGTWFAFAA